MGIRNIRTVRQLKIIDMLHNSQRGNEKFTLYHQLSRWIVIAVIASIAVLGMMFALIMKVSIQPHILWQFIALVIVATLSIVAAIWFFIECRHGKSGSIPLLFLTIPCFIQGIILLILNQVFESLVRQGTAGLSAFACLFRHRLVSSETDLSNRPGSYILDLHTF